LQTRGLLHKEKRKTRTSGLNFCLEKRKGTDLFPIKTPGDPTAVLDSWVTVKQGEKISHTEQ